MYNVCKANLGRAFDNARSLITALRAFALVVVYNRIAHINSLVVCVVSHDVAPYNRGEPVRSKKAHRGLIRIPKSLNDPPLWHYVCNSYVG